MKGSVFAELLEIVEERFSPEIADEIVTSSKLASGGAYTSLGTYDHHEMIALVTNLSRITSVPVAELMRTFGRHLFRRFSVLFPHFFPQGTSALQFLETVDRYVHVEVHKLYPEAELPSFDCQRTAPNTIEMTYRSSRGFADLAGGMIEGCFEHFGERLELSREDLSGGRGTVVRFSIARLEA